MRDFARLYTDLDESNRTNDKLAALESYFRAADPRDAAWALAFLTGNRPPRAVNSTQLRRWVAEAADLPDWLVDECYEAVGDLAETMALLLPEVAADSELPLHRVVEERVLPLRNLDEEARRELVLQTWRELPSRERFLWHKLLLGGFRVGVSRTLVARALAALARVDKAEMAHRLMGTWEPTPESWQRIIGGRADESDSTRPYPFYLASPLESEVSELGPIHEWQAEWKWDGIRAQILKRRGSVMIWSRGEELVTDRYPEVARVAAMLPNGMVLDGELMAWRDDGPLPFQVLQARIGRKNLTRKTLETAPVAFVAYDLLEFDGEDFRTKPLAERRACLEGIVASIGSPVLRVSPLVQAADWEELGRLRGTSRERLVEGLMLKRRTSPYQVGRVRGDWWKWKIEPFTMDVVMVYAQAGHGRRASLYTDYTFAAWRDGELVPVAKAYSGLTDEEIREVDRWIRRNTLDRHGPVRVVKPELVFEIAFEGIQRSSRHKSGIAVRFPRIARQRPDKTPDQADSVERLLTLVAE